ncbi:hypothetical protein M2272_005178 [Mycobacterium frederiksbergense]|uniref:Uncharacterized protein n=1 Tax=Mycolicibacterium frederiksbergense TaxID=117567 RepID=A0ABT6L6H5_9MYCO|nr:hypothetical protein [Mycolicibacterium frederiksbergense]MDH6198519.1 hypothetical protein [Mycolicibacterium frederiksbergense]
MAGADGVDWYDLYKIHEIIGHDIGGKTRLIEIGWTTKPRDRAFTASADGFDVSGEAARHAVDSHEEPPKHTMTIEQGRAYISDLVTKRLDHLASRKSALNVGKACTRRHEVAQVAGIVVQEVENQPHHGAGK